METVKERLRHFIEAKGISVRSFEQTCGLSYGYVGNMRNSMQPDKVKRISRYYPELNTGWLLTGEGAMLRGNEENSLDGIPLIPQEAFAGYGTFQYQDLPVECVYKIRELCNASFLLRVSGDSMSPRYNSGDLVACIEIRDVTYWQWHRIYAICTKSQGILIKRLERGEDPGTITCVSENPAYDSFTIDRDEIISVALVIGGVVVE